MNVNITGATTRIKLTKTETNTLRKASDLMATIARVSEDDPVNDVLAASSEIIGIVMKYGTTEAVPTAQEVTE